jgi:hypothetical protein
MNVKFDTLLASLQDVVLGTGAVAGGSGKAAAFTVAAANSARTGNTGPATGPQAPGGNNPGSGNPGDGGSGGNPGDGGSGGNPRPEPTPTACNNLSCQIPTVFPSATPTSLLEGVLSN